MVPTKALHEVCCTCSICGSALKTDIGRQITTTMLPGSSLGCGRRIS